MADSFEGSVAIVTGAAGGIGGEVVRGLQEAGAAVVAEDVDPAVERLASADGRVLPLVADAATAAGARAAVETALERFGRLDVLVNNAAVFLLKPSLETSEEDWDRLMRTNLKSAFLHCVAALPPMIEAGSGSIVNMSSISGLVGMPGQLAYSVTKGGMVQLTRALAIEHAAAGVRVNAVAPGAVRTSFPIKGGVPEEAWEEIAASHPLGRVAEPAEIARTVLFLASPEAGFITGAVLSADGGYTAQ